MLFSEKKGKLLSSIFPLSSSLPQLSPNSKHFYYFLCVLLGPLWKYKHKQMHILVLPGSYTKGGTLRKLFTVLHLGGLPILMCTKREKEMEGRERGSVRGRKGRQRKKRGKDRKRAGNSYIPTKTWRIYPKLLIVVIALWWD